MLFLLLLMFLPLFSSAESPQVAWSCSSGALIIDLTTDSPFEGRISVGECTVNGTGSRNMQLLIPFVEHDKCGLAYNQSLSSFSTPVSIHFHRALILDSDLSLNVSCFDKPSDFTLSLINSHGIQLRTPAVFGDRYDLKILPQYGINRNQVQILSCFAHGKSSIIELFTSCSTIKNITQMPSRSSSFTIEKMFRLSDSYNRLFIECSYRICDGECSKDCSLSTKPTRTVSTLVDVVDGKRSTVAAVRVSSLPSSISLLLNFLIFFLTLSTCVGALLVTLIVLTRLRAFITRPDTEVCGRREELWISAEPARSISPSNRHSASPIYSNIVTTYH